MDPGAALFDAAGRAESSGVVKTDWPAQNVQGSRIAVSSFMRMAGTGSFGSDRSGTNERDSGLERAWQALAGHCSKAAPQAVQFMRAVEALRASTGRSAKMLESDLCALPAALDAIRSASLNSLDVG